MKNLLAVLVIAISVASFKLQDRTLPKDNLTSSHVQGVTFDSLGPQDQLNRTFSSIFKDVRYINNFTYIAGDVKYCLFNVEPIVKLDDFNQRVFTNENNTLVISGATLESKISFVWRIVTPEGQRGYVGKFIGTSDSIDFWKQIRIENQSAYRFNLTKYEDISWSRGKARPFTIDYMVTDVSEEEKEIFYKMFNGMEGFYSVRQYLEDFIKKSYSQKLSQIVNSGDYPWFKHKFNYTWTPRKGEPGIVIPMVRKAISTQVKTHFILNRYDVMVEGYEKWNQERTLGPDFSPIIRELDDPVQFIGFDFPWNIVAYATETKLLDFQLRKEYWSSSIFRFIAGDLYPVIPLLKQRYAPTTAIDGYCNISAKWQSSEGYYFRPEAYMQAKLFLVCHLNIKDDKIISLYFKLHLGLSMTPNQKETNFSLLEPYLFEDVQYITHGDYELQDNYLALQMLYESLKRICEINLFGNGFPLGPFQEKIEGGAYRTYFMVFAPEHHDKSQKSKERVSNKGEIKMMRQGSRTKQ